jgi:MGT family glycosyltransferase
MSTQNGKNILVLMGLFDGHIPGMIEIVKDLTSLGHNVTCYILDKFKDRLKNTGTKLKVFSIPPINVPPYMSKKAVNVFITGYSYDAILTDAVKSEDKYDYLLVDSFFDGNEINKIFKIPTVISVYIFPLGEETPFVEEFEERRLKPIIPVNKKFNLNIRDFIHVHYIADAKYKLMLTSKLFHPQSEVIDDSFYFIGPSIEERPIDNNFNFKKDENKIFVYISLGTIFNDNFEIFKQFVEAFRNWKDFQVVISIGKHFDVKDLGDLPENILAFNFVPQLQILKIADIFITHGGINSINEAILLNNLPIIVIPQELDQFDNAKQIEKLEAGININNNNLSPEIIRNAVIKFLENKKKYKIGVEKICKSFKEAREERKEVYKKLFI